MGPLRFLLNQGVFQKISERELQEVSPKERLMELLLLRFEVLSEHRAEAEALMRDLKSTPRAWKKHLCYLREDMQGFLAYAGISTAGPLGHVKVLSLTTLYVLGLQKWKDLKTEDTSPLMAFLDKGLTWCDDQMQRYS